MAKLMMTLFFVLSHIKLENHEYRFLSRLAIENPSVKVGKQLNQAVVFTAIECVLF